MSFNNKVVKRLHELAELDKLHIEYCKRLGQEVLTHGNTHLHNSHASEGPVNESRMQKEDKEDVELFRKLKNE